MQIIVGQRLVRNELISTFQTIAYIATKNKVLTLVHTCYSGILLCSHVQFSRHNTIRPPAVVTLILHNRQLDIARLLSKKQLSLDMHTVSWINLHYLQHRVIME